MEKHGHKHLKTVDNSKKTYGGYRSIRYELKVVFSCLTAIPFFVFAFIYFRLGTFNTAISGGLIVLSLVLVLEGFIIFRRMADHIEQLSITMVRAETGKDEPVGGPAETKELAIIADTFNRTLSKLEETAKELGLRAEQIATLNKIREIASQSIRMEEVASTILERAVRVINVNAGYLAVRLQNLVFHIAASSGITGNIPDRIDFHDMKKKKGFFFNSQSPVLIKNSQKELSPELANIINLDFPHLLYLPIVAKGIPIGALVLARDENREYFCEEDTQFLQTLLQQVAYSVENARLYDHLDQSNKKLKLALKSEKKARDQLLTSARLAAFGDLSLNIAHELNNPLTGITGYTDLVLDDSLDEKEKKDYLEEIRNQAVRASRIIRDLIDFAVTKPNVRIKADLNELIKKSISLAEGKIAKNAINIDLKLAKDLPAILVDTAQMGQVFFNLINNALDALTDVYRNGAYTVKKDSELKTKPSFISIETGTKKNRIYIIFKDTGTGIASENISRIFEPFYSTKKQITQAGLGLWSARMFVLAHGGKISVKSRPGVGSAFIIFLPCTENK